ncbi:gpW family head-tail joining protein [Azotobacter chroococcum]|uniref:GpW protein n=1 Tax=Azotobacter chroococcum TaxID=353 RepID=A0AAP9YGH6_9GAMM|nr:gpW family head-tail joining protein [Azotobacter chroococcum]QQE90263.1 hypothetical protein GKQ51_08215 [Azotobacter chroococcum]
MAYTRDDLNKVQAAILALAAGERVVEVRFGNEVTRYESAGQGALKALRDEIKAEILAAEGRRLRGYRLNHRRGL